MKCYKIETISENMNIYRYLALLMYSINFSILEIENICQISCIKLKS